MIPSYPHTLHWPKSLSVHRDDHYHDDPSFFLGKTVMITEKLDGGLTQFAMGQVYARASSDPTREPWFDYVKSRTLPKLYAVPGNLQPIGEDLYGVHSIEYDPLPDSFFLFHVLDRKPENVGTEKTDGDHFWSWSGVKEFAMIYGLRTVPVLFEGTFDKLDHITDWFMTHVKEPSIYGPDREGFVMRTIDSFPFSEFGKHMCKFVRAHHVQTDEHWTKHWKPARLGK
jgi:hypothetical protein